ncbi:fructose-bisphosphatase class III [Tautonia sociabilis]|uniref:Fructose-bisphosphatase class III n=1 Tax=Tautonia sociabilis TaxID=2080755 RepID=A0A432MDQ6_9BACT|nr:fructose-bisphosphatase class III [Tautonia sociabilis]RUL83068.1 fructose-bisphosphatase class III [Tautonia sociabilis]
MSPTLPDPEDELAVLRHLARRFPDPESVVAEIARLSAELTLPKDTIHVISDVHGDDVKLRHVLNNASGTLRPLVERIFAGRKSPEELLELITLIFYPRETLDRLGTRIDDVEARKAFTRRVLPDLFEVIRALARRRSLGACRRAFPPSYADLLLELIQEPVGGRPPAYFEAVLDALLRQEEALRLVHLTARVLRGLAIDELILAGDCWDRGPRGDRVLNRLMRQPNLAFIWGNHDAAWFGACLGHEALIAHVLRISARYRRFSQLEEGYGITLQPLEALVRDQYADDPADAFRVKGTGLRDAETMRRMQKAAAIMQFKLEGQLAERNPQFELADRRLLHRMDLSDGTVEIAGRRYPLTDTHFPTLDPADPYSLSPAERACLDRIRASFLSSGTLWEHMKFLVARGSMYRIRDRHLIFHGCVPCDDLGEFLPLEIDGRPRAGKALYDALDELLVRVLHGRDPRDLDTLWYLWCGARSPLFGKDKIATFENDLVADPAPRHETKNPYFRLIHEPWFCDKVLEEFGVDPASGLIVNGHVPVKVEEGESPLKRSGKAVTIDGAFSQAYGDHGYTLVLEPGRTALALHHHFESVESAVTDGVDIIPEVTELRRWDPPRTVADTERGARIRREIALLERLADAYRRNRIRRV